MAEVAEHTEFWVACAAAGPVLLIPTYLMVRQEPAPGSAVRSGVSVAAVKPVHIHAPRSVIRNNA